MSAKTVMQRLDDVVDTYSRRNRFHSAADLDHSNLAWNAVAQHAERLHMEDEVVHACEINLKVWEMYWHGIVDAGAQAG